MGMKKRITLFIGSLTGGGAERVTVNLANYLVNHEYDVEVLTMSDVADTYILDNKVKRTSLIMQHERKNKFHDLLLRFNRLAHYMKMNNRDCYIVMLPVTIIMMLLLRNRTNAKMIVSERNNPAIYSFVIRKLLTGLAKRVDGYVFQTEDAMKWYANNVENCKTIVIPNAINKECIREPYNGERTKRIVAVGRLNAQKNLGILIEAFSLIADEFSEYTLTIYGEGEEREKLQAYVSELNLSEKISFPGYFANIHQRIENAALYVLSSDYEGMPNALIEAMAMGLPCVSTDCPCGGPSFLIENGVNGLLVPVGDSKSMAQAMKRVLSDQEYATRIGTKAAEVKERLNPERIYGQWEAFIKQVCSEIETKAFEKE